jgi:hypothetical protein
MLSGGPHRRPARLVADHDAYAKPTMTFEFAALVARDYRQQRSHASPAAPSRGS